MSNVTIKDIARISGVSLATVSRVINEKGYVSRELREQVMKAVESTGYRPNQTARALAQRRSGSIGIIVHNLHDPFFYDLIRGFEDAASEISYKVLFASVVGGDTAVKTAYLQYLSGGVVDAVVMYGSYISDEEMLRCVSRSSTVDYLMIENDIPEFHCNKLLIKNREGAGNAVRYLMGKGHTEIAHICGNPNNKVTIDRLNGYLEAMRAGGMEVRNGFIQHISASYRSGYDCMQRLISLEQRPTAVFCSDDAIASYAVRAALDSGLRVPEDISIMGFDLQTNLPEHYRGPEITTVQQPLYQMGYDGITLLAEQLERGSFDPLVRKEYDTSIVEQGTVCAPRPIRGGTD